MTTDELVAKLGNEYDRESGFLGKLREGHFDQTKADQFLSLWNEIDLDDDSPVNRELVKLLWFTPIFIGWQIDRIDPGQRRAAKDVLNAVESTLEDRIGTP